MKRPYELMYILDTRIEESAQTELNEKIQSTISEIGGTHEKTEVWGRKKLAYPIQKRTEGLYMLTHFEADSDSLDELNRIMSISEGLLRHIVVRRDES